MTSWTSLNETSCWVILVLIIFRWRKVELSLSWKLTFVLIKASMLVPDQFNWQVWCLRFLLSLYSPLCTDLAVWFGVLVLKSHSSALAANNLAHCQKCLFFVSLFQCSLWGVDCIVISFTSFESKYISPLCLCVITEQWWQRFCLAWTFLCVCAFY